MKGQKDGRQGRKCYTIKRVDAGSSVRSIEVSKKRENRENKSENLPKK